MRRFLIALALGAFIGVVIGLLLGWVQFPVQTINSPIRNLSALDKARYVVMVAEGYEVDGDLPQAIDRIQLLGVSDVPSYVRTLTEGMISESGTGDASDIRHLVALSQALGELTAPMQPFAGPTLTPQAG